MSDRRGEISTGQLAGYRRRSFDRCASGTVEVAGDPLLGRLRQNSPNVWYVSALVRAERIALSAFEDLDDRPGPGPLFLQMLDCLDLLPSKTPWSSLFLPYRAMSRRVISLVASERCRRQSDQRPSEARRHGFRSHRKIFCTPDEIATVRLSTMSSEASREATHTRIVDAQTVIWRRRDHELRSSVASRSSSRPPTAG